MSVSQFMKMKPEYHFKFEVFVLSCPSFLQEKATLPWLGWPHCGQNGVGILFIHISVLNTMIFFDLTFLIRSEKVFVMNLGWLHYEFSPWWTPANNPKITPWFWQNRVWLKISKYRVDFSTVGSPRFTSAMKLRRLGSSGIWRVPVWDILVGDSPVAQRSGLGLLAFLSYMNIICFCERYIALTIIQYFRKKKLLVPWPGNKIQNGT